MEGFWRHSLCVGTAAKQIAKRRGVDPKLLEEYFTAGLLHDLGKVPLNAVLPKEYLLTVSAADRDRCPLVQEEDRSLGINHCAAGALIVTAWQLEGPVGDAITCHHDLAGYTGPHGDVLRTVSAANYFACTGGIGFSGDRYPEKLACQDWEALGIDRELDETMKTLVVEEIEKAKIFLKI
jgi:putative nucleotidyltransferase with HDIG domain